MLKLWVKYQQLRDDNDGAALIEYGLLVGLISIVCVVAITATGVNINKAFDQMASHMSNL